VELTSDTATTLGARDHARSRAGTQARGMPTVAAADATDLPGACTGTAIWEETVERLNLAGTVKVQWQASPTTGTRLLSDMGHTRSIGRPSSGSSR
jgi:uncharacterized protein